MVEAGYPQVCELFGDKVGDLLGEILILVSDNGVYGDAMRIRDKLHNQNHPHYSLIRYSQAGIGRKWSWPLVLRFLDWRCVMVIEAEVIGRLVGGEGGGLVVGADSTRCWRVLHTRSRQEKVVARSLEQAGHECFLPLVKRAKYYGHRKRVTEQPLFACYVFLFAPLEASWPVESLGRVVNVIAVRNQGKLEREIGHIRRVLQEGGALDRAERMPVGSRVRVTSGPFKDIEGILERWGGKHRLVLQVEALGQAAGLEIEASLVEPVEAELSEGTGKGRGWRAA